ncbi:MAG: hypothetical protein WBF71_06070, partial [Microthrixaceae bacterium]
IRPSGTEPKVKLYCEAIEPVGSIKSADPMAPIAPTGATGASGASDTTEVADPIAIHEAVEQARRVAATRLELVEADLRHLLVDPG